MTRTVFDTAMVAHVWAQGRQEEGRNSRRSVYFEGPRLFSYGSHFLTGYRLPDGAAFLNSTSHSVTTSGHQSDARRAVTGARYYLPRGTIERVADLMEGGALLARESGVYPPAYRAATREEQAEARPRLVKLFLEARETAPRESIVAALRYAGAKPEEAAKAAARVIAAHEKRAKEEAAADLKAAKERAANDAKESAARPLGDFAAAVQEARNRLSAHNWCGAWERHASELLSDAKWLFKARKEAKARGWTRIAADLKARESILRAGAAGLEAFAARSQARMQWGNYREAVQTGLLVMSGVRPDLFGEDKAKAWGTARKGAESLANACRNGLNGQAYMQARARLAGADLASMTAGLEALARAFGEREEAAKREERAAALAKAAAALAAWREGTGPRPGYLSDTEGGALLRATGVELDESGAIVGGTLETSHGASVPLTHALRAFRFLKLCRDKGQAWQANGKTLPVGHFRIERVTAEGNFKAGCHVINWPEVAALAARLGVADLAPADTTEAREGVHA